MNIHGSAAVDAPSVAADRSRAAVHYLDLAVRAVLWLYLAALPFRGLLFVERHAFILLMVLLACWAAVHRRLFWVASPIDIPLLAFLGWVAISLPFASFPSYSLKEFGKLLQCVLVFYAVLHFLRDEKSRKAFVSLFVGITAVMAVYGLTQYDPLNQQAMTSFLTSEVWLTTYLVLFVPLCFGLAYGERQVGLRCLGVAAGLASVACLILTRSRAGSVALVIELILLAWLFRRWKGMAIGLLSAMVLVVLLWSASFMTIVKPDIGGEVVPMNKNVHSVVHRFDIWKFSLSEILKHPFVGIGYGNNTFLMLYGQESEVLQPGHNAVRQAGTHNVLLYYALHVGLPGVALFLWMICRAFIHLMKSLRDKGNDVRYGIAAAVLAGMAGGLIRFQFDMMFVGTLAVMFWILMAMGLAHATEAAEPRSRTRET